MYDALGGGGGGGGAVFIHIVLRCTYKYSCILRFLVTKPYDSWISMYGDELFLFVHIHSLRENNIGDAGAQALAKGLQYCTNLQKLE